MEDPNRNQYKSEHLTVTRLNAEYKTAILLESDISPFVLAGDYRMQQPDVTIASALDKNNQRQYLYGEYIEYAESTHETCIILKTTDIIRFLQACDLVNVQIITPPPPAPD
jgi:hypothetical protein